MNDPLWIVAVLAANVALAEWIGQRGVFRYLGSALTVILLTAIFANVGVIPAYGDGVPLYDGVFAYVAPVAIFWLLLGVELRGILRLGRGLLLAFGLGAVGTFLGVVGGFQLLEVGASFEDHGSALTGMFVGTYIGGSINFNAVALHHDIVSEGALYASATAVDNLITTVWMVATLLLPKLLGCAARGAGPVSGRDQDTESVHPFDLGVLIAMGVATLLISERVADRYGIPSILVLTTIGLVLAQFPVVQKLRGARTLGMFSVTLFLAVIGALCDVSALRDAGGPGLHLLGAVALAVAFHGLVVFGGSRLLKIEPTIAAVASQANVGGGTSALALARSLGRADLVLPAILLGSLGNGLGTYLGLAASRWF